MYRVVMEWMSQSREGKAIVYGGSIERVERLGEMLSCEVFHSKVDTIEGKERRLRRWMREGRLVVATNALGLGVDVPDVRLVVYVGMSRRLRDYVQESGRTGRDGGRSEAVVVCGKTEERVAEEGEGGRLKRGGEGKGPGWEEVVKEYIEGKRCRRAVLDEVMDGWERVRCEEGEERCDIYVRRDWELMVAREIEIAEETG